MKKHATTYLSEVSFRGPSDHPVHNCEDISFLNGDFSRVKKTSEISVFIPVYRESELLEPLLLDLLADPCKGKEVFVVVDEPTQKSLLLAETLGSRVHFILNGERKGKANVLNEVVNESSGEIFLFLDADVQIDRSPDRGSGSFLESIREEMKEAEIIEMRKDVVRDSFLARIVSYDYVSFSFASWFFSRRLKRCLGVNGAAFAVKREVFIGLGGFQRVACEDLDIGTRSFISGARFKFSENVIAYTKAPSSWKEWFKQRRRWGIGAAFWLKENSRDLSRIVKKYPGVLLPTLLFLFPSLPVLLINLFTPDELYVKLLYVSLLFLSTRASLLLPPVAFTSTTLSVLRNLFLMISSLGTYSSIFYVVTKKLKYSFNPLEFTFYYLVYSPLWLLIVISAIVRTFVKPEATNNDWKI